MSISTSSRIALLRTEHAARDTVALLETETPDFIPPTLWPPNSADLNPVDYKIWSSMQEKVTDLEYVMSVSCAVELWRHGTKWISASLMNQSNSGVLVFAHAQLPKGVNLNLNFN